ncbi:vacuolar protein sorting protein VPS51 [Acrasis kona]|uniref:Vacuolar protein sorting-associated protein 51 homolog n=1 Tax=Acrasis kona TaxID=1008807 RepID=A0AAW2YVQ4_9EUKA
MMSMLAQYYKTKTDDKQAAKTAVNVSDIDSEGFDSTLFVKKLLDKVSLEELMRKDRKLSEEIKKLDTDLQMLVYENYNKFITATDTIKKMKKHVEGMEGEMKDLTENMDKIAACNDVINDNLAPKRSKIEKLSSVNRMLRKMQFLIELPSRLEQCLEMKSFAVAVKYYNLANHILKQYSHLPSFQNIHERSMEVVVKLKQHLKDALSEPASTHSILEENVRLLLDLDEAEADVRRDFLNGRRKVLTDILSMELKDVGITQNLKDLNSNFISKFQQTVRVHNQSFKSNTGLIEFTRELFNQYFKISKKILLDGYQNVVNMNGMEQSSMTDLKSAVLMFAVDLFVVHARLPEAALSDKISNVLSDAVRQYLTVNVKFIKNKCQDLISNIAKFKPREQATLSIINEASNEMLTSFETLISHYKIFIDMKDVKLIETKINLFKSWIKSYLVGLLFNVMDMIGKCACPHSIVSISKERVGNAETTPVGALMLSRLAIMIGNEVISQVQQLLTDASNNDYFMGGKVIEGFHQVAGVMVVHYIEQSGLTCGHFIRAGMERDWLSMDVPRGEGKHVTILTDETNKIFSELVAILPQGIRRSHSNESLQSGTATTISNAASPFIMDGLSSDMNYMMKSFNKKLATFRIKSPKDIQVRSVMMEILKITCKTFEEYVRLLTFGKNGFQQLQVDVAFLKMTWQNQCGVDEHAISSLLNEVQASTSERCLEPTPLDPKVVANLLDKKFSKK